MQVVYSFDTFFRHCRCVFLSGRFQVGPLFNNLTRTNLEKSYHFTFCCHFPVVLVLNASLNVPNLLKKDSCFIRFFLYELESSS